MRKKRGTLSQVGEATQKEKKRLVNASSCKQRGRRDVAYMFS